MTLDAQVVRVFADESGQWGNPLGIVDAGRISEDEYQSVAEELGFSETVFLDFPDGPRTSVDVRIFTPATELPFAGHPSVGTAVWLAARGTPVHSLAVPAGEVRVRVEDSSAWVRARADWAPLFDLRELSTPGDVDALNAADTDEDAGHLYYWAWADREQTSVRARMFAPSLGVPEDEATGAAAVRLTDAVGRGVSIVQGRGSHLTTAVLEDGWIELGGRVVADSPRTVTVG
ncbi:MAG: PhzF family phenazine biosynthesis protein [Rhodococcus sp. (in: high G+C Gram-positive bacteria)]